jgi:Glycosyl transferases group 1
MEPSRRWQPKLDLPHAHTVLRSWTFDLARLAVGAGFKTREDTYLYVPKRPLAALSRFAPDAVVARVRGVWSSPANIAVLAARARHDWAFVPWWGSLRRESQTLPRRLAEPWVKAFIRASDAWLAYGWGADDLVVGRPATQPQKEHEFLLRAVARIGAEDDVKLLVVGAPHETHRAFARHLYEHARSLGLVIGEDVLCLGGLRDVRPALATMDLFVRSSVSRSEVRLQHSERS